MHAPTEKIISVRTFTPLYFSYTVSHSILSISFQSHNFVQEFIMMRSTYINVIIISKSSFPKMADCSVTDDRGSYSSVKISDHNVQFWLQVVLIL